ncbi:MAG: ParA family protein [Lachnospiraceae bacterium]|nr:ParA family protein [Lachnospiraceae bacterium]
MGTAIAFLSGKGGSGKTTLALSIADLLCRCKVKTLLVDCDLSTNGASYFYEAKLVNWNKGAGTGVTSFSRLLNGNSRGETINVLAIAPDMDFIPSISSFSSQHLTDEVVWYDSALEARLQNFIEWAKNSYEVILFDCQAGYTELLPVLLPLMDVDLFVLEADSISASAMRNLHLKIGNSLGRAQLYQVFNKATKEEFDIYSKIVGTFFTNIGTLLFDWKIRQAFSRSQVPDLEYASAQYGADLCDICKIIFQGGVILERLERFSLQSRYRQLEEKRRQVEEKMYEKTRKGRLIPQRLVPILFLGGISTVLFTLSYLVLVGSLYMDRFYQILTIAIGGILLSIFAMGILEKLLESRYERRKYERELKNLSRESEKLKYQMKKAEKGD